MENLTELKEKLKSFAIVCLWVFGAIGGVGFALYGDSWPCAIGSLVNTILAFPVVKKNFDYLKS